MADGARLYLEIDPSSGKYWRFKYRRAGKEKWISLGVYPEVKLPRVFVSARAHQTLVAQPDLSNLYCTERVTFTVCCRAYPLEPAAVAVTKMV